MELRKTDDPKMELLHKSAKYRQDLEDEVRLISERTEKIITNALIIGGTLAAAYFIVRQFSGSGSKKSVKTQTLKVIPSSAEETAVAGESTGPGIVSQIGTALASQVTVFLLSMAKEKLTEYLQSQFEKKEK